MLNWSTVSTQLRIYLLDLMQAEPFENFRLVGGTALSLHLGHRMSVDIDLFTDQAYGTVNFEEIETYLINRFAYFDRSNHGIVGMGNSYLIGEDADNSIKLDIYYTDTFIQEVYEEDGVRLATVEEITAMKIDVILRGGRKKDFWDLHEILDQRTIAEMLILHEQRHPYTHDKMAIIAQLQNFSGADNDFNPICLRGKH